MKRWPLFAAIGYVALLFGGAVALPAMPDVNDSGAKLVLYFQDHGDGIRVATWLNTLATIPIVLLIAHLRSRVSGIRRDVLLLGGAGLVVGLSVWSWFNAGLALHADTLDPQVARTIADVGSYFGPVVTVSIVLLIVPIGLTAWEGNGGFPRWLAWLTGLFALEQMIETITVMGKRGFIAPGGAMNNVLGAGLGAVWLIAAGAATRAPAPADDGVSSSRIR
jgi:type IV secretory pathway VirB2 component (pilin)